MGHGTNFKSTLPSSSMGKVHGNYIRMDETGFCVSHSGTSITLSEKVCSCLDSENKFIVFVFCSICLNKTILHSIYNV